MTIRVFFRVSKAYGIVFLLKEIEEISVKVFTILYVLMQFHVNLTK